MITTKTRAANAQNATFVSINGGVGFPGSLRIYSGAAPALVTDAPTGTLLANCAIGTGANPAFGNTNTGTMVATGDVAIGYFARDASIDASGTAGYFRILDSAGVAVYQGTVGIAGSGAELILSTLTLVALGVLTINTFSIQITGIY